MVDPDRDEILLSPRKVYIRVLVVCLCLFFAHLSYYPLAGIYTSLNAEIGFVAFGTLWMVWFLGSLFLAPPLVSSLRPRLTVFIGTLCYLLFVVLNYHQSWATLVIAGASEGLGAALIWTGLLTSLAISAKSLAQIRNKPQERYISTFNGLFSLSYCSSALIGSAISSLFLLPSQSLMKSDNHHNSFLQNSTSEAYILPNKSLSDLMNSTAESVCSERPDGFEVPTWAYYGLVSTSAVLTLCSVVLTVGLGNISTLWKVQNRTSRVYCSCCSTLCPKNTQECLSWTSSTLKWAKGAMKEHYKPIVRAFFRWSHIVAMPISFVSGLSQGYFFGTFSRHFISDCLGVGVVGLAVIAWGITSCTFSLAIGKISYYTSRTVVAIATALLHTGMILFMLFWEREASYVMVFLTALGWGIVDGVWMTLPAIYVGVAAKPVEAKAAFGIVKGFLAFGGTMNFFVSAYIPVNVNLWIILSVLVVAVVVYLVGEKVFTPSNFCKDKGEDDLKSDTFGKEGQKPLELVFSPMPETVTVVVTNPLFIDDDEDVASSCTGDMNVAETSVNIAVHEKT